MKNKVLNNYSLSMFIMSFESYRIQPVLVIVSLYIICLDHNPVTPRADIGICPLPQVAFSHASRCSRYRSDEVLLGWSSTMWFNSWPLKHPIIGGHQQRPLFLRSLFHHPKKVTTWIAWWRIIPLSYRIVRNPPPFQNKSKRPWMEGVPQLQELETWKPRNVSGVKVA